MIEETPDATGRSVQNYQQITDHMRIATMAYHFEILQQSLKEALLNANDSKTLKLQLDLTLNNYLFNLMMLIYLLRCGFLHTRGKLTPKWDTQKTKNKANQAIIDGLVKNGFSIKIPCIKETGGYRFNKNSKHTKKINFKIVHNREIIINDDFIGKARLLTWHIFTIVKIRKKYSLIKYLKKTI